MRRLYSKLKIHKQNLSVFLFAIVYTIYILEKNGDDFHRIYFYYPIPPYGVLPLITREEKIFLSIKNDP